MATKKANASIAEALELARRAYFKWLKTGLWDDKRIYLEACERLFDVCDMTMPRQQPTVAPGQMSLFGDEA